MSNKNWFYKTPVTLYQKRQHLLSENDGGVVYFIYTALLAESVLYNGKLMDSDTQPHTITSLTRKIKVGNVRGMTNAINILIKHKIIEIRKGNVYFMAEIPELTLSRHDLKEYNKNKK